MIFIVITKIPDITEDGNKAHDFLYDGYDEINKCKCYDVGVSELSEKTPVAICKTAVFEKGEVLICDDDGREIPYPCRKPSKWDGNVEYLVYNNIKEALKKCEEMK
jgi:hypothetical protein